MRLCFAAVLCLIAVLASADEQPASLQGEIGASWLASYGNTNNSTYGLWGEVIHRPGPYKLGINGGFMRSTVERATSSRRSYASLRGERKTISRLNMDVRADYYADEPAGTRRQFAAGSGAVFRVYDSEHRTLAVSALVSKTWERRVNPPDRIFLGTQLGLECGIRVNDTLSFTHESSYVRDLSDHFNWRASIKTSLLASLHRHVAFKLSHQLYRNKPDAGKRAVDMGVIASLVASWPGPNKP